MVHRDPDTGQFVSGDHGFSDIEVATFSASAGVPASQLSGGTAFEGSGFEWEGTPLLDYDEFVDRNEELILLEAQHAISAFINSTETADGSMAVAVEVSASPVLSVSGLGLGTSNIPGDATAGVRGNSLQDDSIDVIGRPLKAFTGAPFSDGATGVGGGGSAGEDRLVTRTFPAEYGRFHPRDDLFFNGELAVWNVDDAGVHVELTGQHVYGVVPE